MKVILGLVLAILVVVLLTQRSKKAATQPVISPVPADQPGTESVDYEVPAPANELDQID